MRKSPLKTRKSLNREGASTLRWKSWRTRQRAIAMERAQNKCEFHFQTTHTGTIEWNHLFGRDDEPWSSYHPFTLIMCLDTHRKFHHDAEFRNLLQWTALVRYMKYSENEFKASLAIYGTAMNLWNALMRDRIKQGAMPPEYVEQKPRQRKNATTE